MNGLIGFDVKTLTDDELMDRVVELNRRIAYSSRFMSGTVTAALHDQRVACENEQRERAILSRLQARAKEPPVCVETDPDLAAAYRAEVEAETIRNTPKSQPRQKPFSPQRSDRIERLKPTTRPTGDQ